MTTSRHSLELNKHNRLIVMKIEVINSTALNEKKYYLSMLQQGQILQ